MSRATSNGSAGATIKLQLAAIRQLFDWLVVGQVMPTNPAASVRGPKHVVKRGKRPVLSAAEARRLLASIDISTHVGLRDRAFIGLMAYSFARVGAATAMKVEDVFTQDRRLWLRLREKGGKRHEMPCHHNLEAYLLAYLEGTGDHLRRHQGAAVPHDRPHDRPAHAYSFPAAQRLSDDRPARPRGRHQDQGGQSYVPRDRNHHVSQGRRFA